MSVCKAVVRGCREWQTLVKHCLAISLHRSKMFLSSLGTLKPAKWKFYFCLHVVCGCCIKLQYFKAVRRQIKGTACGHIYGIQTCCCDHRKYIAESRVYILAIIVWVSVHSSTVKKFATAVQRNVKLVFADQFPQVLTRRTTASTVEPLYYIQY